MGHNQDIEARKLQKISGMDFYHDVKDWLGLALLVLKTDAARDIIVKVASIVIAAASVYL